jgi:hypothetical protein
MPKGIPKDFDHDPRKTKPRLKKKAGRKKIRIDWKKVESFIIHGASGVQIASYLGIDKHTLYHHCKQDLGLDFSYYWQEKWEKGNLQLHAKQYQEAMKGDRGLLIWLGKNRLKQTDKIEQKIEAQVEVKQKRVLRLPDNGNRNIKN